jgi:hypothetical protein
MRNQPAPVPPGALGGPAATGRGLGTTEAVVIVIVITWATALVLCGMSAAAALELLAGAGVLGVHLLRQARA